MDREELEEMIERAEAERTDSIPMDKKVEDLLVAFKRYLDKESRRTRIIEYAQWLALILIALIMDAADIVSLIL